MNAYDGYNVPTAEDKAKNAEAWDRIRVRLAERRATAEKVAREVRELNKLDR